MKFIILLLPHAGLYLWSGASRNHNCFIARRETRRLLSNQIEVELEIRILRECLSRLSTAVLCVNSSLDLRMVLHEIVASPRKLVGASCGMVTTIDETVQP